MSIVTDRRCDGCKKIVAKADIDWHHLTPAGWEGEDKRKDFCDLNCLRLWLKSKDAEL